MHVETAMVPNPTTTRPEVPFKRLLAGLVRSGKSKAAVLDGAGRLVGLIGVHDILKKIVPHYVGLDAKLMEVMHAGYFGERLLRLEGMTVADLMSTEIDSVAPDDPLIKAVSVMVERRRKALPVIDADGRFLGLVTRRSILARVTESTGLLD
jgi:CBS-domain-containing membrane protein